MSKKPLFLAIVLLTLLAFSSPASAANDNVTVDVVIASVSQITVSPDTLSWTVSPGSAGTTKDVDIINIGSANVSLIYAFVDTITDEATRPYGSLDSTDYSAGGVIVFKNSTYNKFFFAGRLEWNWTTNITNMYQGGVNSPVAWGFFRNTSYEYNWILGNGTNGFCNNTGAQFAVERNVDNGTTSSRSPGNFIADVSSVEEGLDWGYFYVSGSNSPLYQSCVAAYYDCSKVYIYAYDKRSGFGNCDYSQYIQTGDLTPSNKHTLTLNVYVPYGIPASPGNLNTATFTVWAS